MYYVYILKSEKSGKWYTGSTDDLRKRLKQHNDGKSTYTRAHRPFILIYYEACSIEGDARSRELFLKSGMGKRYLKNRLKRFLSLTG
ncbi:MAG: GIY-YIG nuclease family protein [Candidatus Pacebacteria bacterium]|nr:GIY-YIG nuclease family protein [Candidatus Paceibacterota bacterium]MDD5357284.1 GIY-YIG nuclease family protein [Candidatus Paceibacterota bacterium]